MKEKKEGKWRENRERKKGRFRREMVEGNQSGMEDRKEQRKRAMKVARKAGANE